MGKLPSQADAAAAAVLITARNCELVAGVSWSWARRFATQQYVSPIHVGRKTAYVAVEFTAAMRRASELQAAAETDQDAQRRVRAALGVVAP